VARNEPVYVRRRQKFKNGLISIVIGLGVWHFVAPLGQLLVGVGLFMLFSAVIRGRERIA